MLMDLQSYSCSFSLFSDFRLDTQAQAQAPFLPDDRRTTVPFHSIAQSKKAYRTSINYLDCKTSSSTPLSDNRTQENT